MNTLPKDKPFTLLALGLMKCPACEFYTFSREDLEAHKQTHWKPSRNSDGEWMPCECDTYLTARARQNGSFVLGNYEYCLIENKVLYRKKARAFL